MFLYYLIAVFSVSLYLHGFFPIPAGTFQQSDYTNVTKVNAKFQKSVIIIIDALRLDFITPRYTPFLSRISESNGCFITLKVETPTVTLPRIKALTTGHVPQFIDIIVNLASPTKLEDSFIHQAYLTGKKIVFYGDDIWLKLFPKHFERSEGTSSFYVNDFQEVDDNVTRNVKQELHKTDWDIMILHYLGLDHIGHVYGPKSHLILHKLKEMDTIIEEIYNNTKETLILVTGDHGMRDSGGHGGSTFSETNVPLLVLGMSCRNDTFSQIDIPVHLAILLGFKIPSTSIGQLHSSFLSHLSLLEYLEALKYNTLFLNSKMNSCKDNIETAKYFHDIYVLNKTDEFGYKAAKLYEECSKTISENLLKSSVKQNMGSLFISTLMAICVIFKILHKMCGIQNRAHRWEQITMFVVLVLQFLDFGIVSTLVLIVIILLILMKDGTHFTSKHLPDLSTFSFLLIMLILHPISFLSSSFLEEEHQFWYYFGSTYLLIKFIDSNSKLNCWMFMLVVLRFLRTINQVGDKWASVPDFSDWLLKSENYVFLQLMFVSGLILIFYCNILNTRQTFSSAIDGLTLLLVYIYRTVINENVILGEILWVLIFIKFMYNLIKHEGFLSVWVLITTLLLKPYNTVLIPACILASQQFHQKLDIEISVLAHWWMGNLLFFAQGHDNSLASVDISSGYVGLTSYNPFFVIPQVLCHTYAFPVLSHLLLFRNKNINALKYFTLFIMFRMYIIVIVFIVMFIQRYHLFIWSVFAPKIFIEASHLLFLFVEICLYYVNCFIKKFFSR